MKLTFPKISAGVYGVHIDGHDTGLQIVRADYERKQWGGSQSWDIVEAHDPDSWLCSAKGFDHAKATLQTLAQRLTDHLV